MEAGIEQTLKERGDIYGSFDVGTKNFSIILDSIQDIHIQAHGGPMSTKELMPIIYLVMKMVRLGTTPMHLDTWHDIQGYAKLTEDMYKEKTKC